jgi:hypothetical protein
MIIYDRWGKSIFSTSGLNNAWKGCSEDGAACSMGTYIYKLWVTDFNNTERLVTGQVNLIR